MRKLLYALLALALGANVALATNDYFNASGVPSTGAALNSATMRGEFSSIGAGFDKLPTLTGNGNKVVTVNAGGTALTATTATALSGMTIGTNIQAWDADLDAVAALSSTGFAARTASNTWAQRTVTGTANEITVTDGNGVSGNPTLSIPSAVTLTGKTLTGGTHTSGTYTASTITNPTATSQTLSDGATVSWDMNSGGVATITLGGNRTMDAPTNLKVGTYLLHVVQDGTGSRTITWNSVFKWSFAVAPTLSTGAGKRDIISFVSDGTNLYGSYMLDVR
jgi:hypothetical protein